MLRKITVSACALGAIGGLVSTSATASSVYPGCASPVAKTTAHSFYVDPVHGSMTGDGSAAKPWHTLAEVVSAGLITTAPTANVPGKRATNASIAPGDTVYLLSGNHGTVNIQGYYGSTTGTLLGYNNPDFITFAALPGQMPVINQLKIVGGNKWVFRGITFQSTNPSGVGITTTNGVHDYFLVSLTGPHNDIILDGNNLLSASDVSNWKMGDWLNKRASGITEIAGQCIAITSNKLKNVGFGLGSQRSNNILISGNVINYFTDDGIDYGSNNMLMTHNVITNTVEDGDGFHRDGMQGQPSTQTTTLSNITIDSNTVIRIADPAFPYPGTLQGIDDFDGISQNFTVTNNIVITDAQQGISFYGTRGLTIKNNTLLGDSGRVMPCYGLTYANCILTTMTTEKLAQPAIRVSDSKASVAASGVNVSYNITSGLMMANDIVTPVVAHNLCLLTNGKCLLGISIGGVTVWKGSPGTYGSDNVIPTFLTTSFFDEYNTTTAQYNLTLKLINPAI